jgi:hypothetical protein
MRAYRASHLEFPTIILEEPGAFPYPQARSELMTALPCPFLRPSVDGHVMTYARTGLQCTALPAI